MDTVSSDSSVYDESLSVRDNLYNMKMMIEEIKMSRYNLVLEFINKWMKYKGDNKIKSLTNFKNVTERDLIKNKKYNRKLIKEYCNEFKKKFGIKLSIKKNTPDEKISKRYIIYMVRKALVKLDYTMKARDYKDKTYYTIYRND